MVIEHPEGAVSIEEDLDAKFRAKNVRVVLYPETETMEFSTLTQFRDFMMKKKDFWSECDTSKTSKIDSHFQQTVSTLDRALNQSDCIQGNPIVDNTISRSERCVLVRLFPVLFDH